MYENKIFIDETEEIVTYDEIKNHFANEMEDWERAEYNNCFDDYLACCMWFNGGTLSVYEGIEKQYLTEQTITAPKKAVIVLEQIIML